MTSPTPFLGPLTPKISKIQSGQKNLKKIMVTRFRFEMTKIFFVRQFFLSFGVQGPLWSKKWLKRALKRGQRVKKFKSAFFCVFGYKMNKKNFGLEFKHQHPTRWQSALHYLLIFYLSQFRRCFFSRNCFLNSLLCLIFCLEMLSAHKLQLINTWKTVN